MRRTRNAISSKLYNARVAVSSRSQSGCPSPFPDFHPGRSGFAVSFIFFHLIGICRGFCPSSAYFTSSPPGPALHSPVAKISFLLSFQPSPWCAPLSPFLSVLPGFVFPRRESFFAFFFSPAPSVCSIVSFPLRIARLCIPPSRKFLCFFLFNRPLGVLHCFLSSPYCPALHFPVTKVSLLLSFQRKKGPSLRGTPFPRFFFLIS